MNAASVTLSNVGVFIIGGIQCRGSCPPYAIYNTSEFLPPGTMQWQEGPSLPVQMEHPLAVQITNTSFLVIHRTSIFEFDAAIAGPTSNKGWAEATKWPRLEPRLSRSCGKVGRKVIIAGCGRPTEVLDLDRRQIVLGGRMSAARRVDFHIAILPFPGGKEKAFVLAGGHLDTAEEWVEESLTWRPADNLLVKRLQFGAVTLPKRLICPV